MSNQFISPSVLRGDASFSTGSAAVFNSSGNNTTSDMWMYNSGDLNEYILSIGHGVAKTAANIFVTLRDEKVGIGTNDPSYLLDIGGTTSSVDNTIRIGQNNGGTAIRIGSGGGSSDVVLLRIDGTAAGHDGASDSGAFGFSVKYFGTPSGNANRFGILSDNQQAATQVEAITILQDGSVGIGTTSPGAKLNVAGDVLINSGEYISWGTAGATSIEGSTTSNKLQFRTNSSDRMIIDSAGNVGIGTTNPAQKFVIANATNGQGVEIIPGTTGYLQAYDRGASVYVPLNIDTLEARVRSIGATVFNNGSGFSESMRITSAGDVGIGTTGPVQKLHIVDTNGANIILNSNTGAENNGVFMTEGGVATPYVNGAYVHYDSTNNIFKINTGAASLATRFEIARDTGAIKFNSYGATDQTGTPTYLLGTDASGNVVKTLTTPSPITSQAASLYDLIPNGAFTTTYAFTSTAGTYAEVMKGDDVITANGTYTVQMLVNDHAVGGTQYSETYSGIMSWGSSTNTNDTGGGTISQIVLHRSGHAANQGMTYLRTRETVASEGNELRLEIMCNRTYSAASNVVFKFVRLI